MRKLLYIILSSAAPFAAAAAAADGAESAAAAASASASSCTNKIETANIAAAKIEAAQTVCDFLKNTGHYFLATADKDQPRVRPFGTAMIFEGRLYIQTGRSKDVSKQIAANPKVEICAFDQAAGKWIRIAATLVDDPRVEVKTRMLEEYPMLKNMYKADDENTQTLYIKDATATISSFAAAPVELAF